MRKAGWDGNASQHPAWRDLLDARKRNRWGNFTWISPGPLLASMNDLVAKGMDDLINQIRPRWVAQQQGFEPKPNQLEIDKYAGRAKLSLFLLGDPGEQDASQYAVVDPMLAQEKAKKTDFMVIVSDVIYPAGDINDYLDGFYLPYRDYEPDLRDTGKPRLVRRAQRVHVALLRGRGIATDRLPGGPASPAKDAVARRVAKPSPPSCPCCSDSEAG